MNINDLPWWKENYKSERRTNCDFFEYLNKEEFLIRLKKYPLSKNLVTSFLDNRVSRINLVKLSTKKFYGKIYRTSPWNYFNFEVMINASNSLNEKSSTLIHECIHGIYRVVGNSDKSVIERILCEEEHNFFSKNKEFAKDLFKRRMVKNF